MPRDGRGKWYLPMWIPLPDWGWLRKLANRALLNCDNCFGDIWCSADIRTDRWDNVLCPQCGDPETLRDLEEANPEDNQPPYPEL